MPYGGFEKLGAVLVIERLRCRGKRINELGELEPCGAVYDRPAKKLAQLYRTPPARSAYSIKMIKEADQTLGYPYAPEEPIIGKHRTIYIQESYCDQCQLCFRPNIEWDAVHSLPLPAKQVELAKLNSPEEYATACSRRDQLRNEWLAAREEAKQAIAKRQKLLDEYHLACDTVHACARYYYDRIQRRYIEKPSVKLNTSAKEKVKIIPMTLDDI